MYGDFGLTLGGCDNIDGDVTLRHEVFPFIEREIRITACQSYNKVVFPGLDVTFSQVSFVVVRGNTLEVNVIFSE